MRIAKLAVAFATAAVTGLALTAAVPVPEGLRPMAGRNYTLPAAGPSITSSRERTAAPSFTFFDGMGVPRSISSFRGKVVLVNFWATWCGPCIKEMPSLSALQTKLSGLPFEVLALSQDRGGVPVAKSFYAQQKITNLKLYIDQGGKAGYDLGVQGLPTSLLLDSSGREVMRIVGSIAWDDPTMVAAITRVMQGY